MIKKHFFLKRNIANKLENSGHAGVRYPVYTCSVHVDKKIYKLKAMQGATVHAELADARLNKTAYASIYFENELGGRILALGTKFTGSNLLYNGRLKQLQKVVEKLFFGKLLFRQKNETTIATFLFKDNTGTVLLLCNFGFNK